jgi:hypothetical protein
MEHGLFGCIQGNYLPANIQDLNKTIKYVKDKSQKNRCILYHGFLSLSSEKVIEQVYKSRTKWKDLLADKMSDVAKANSIKRENLEWIAAYHMKKDQSHCHLIFWDKNQEIKDPFIPKSIFDKKMEWIRGQFAKEIFRDDFKNLYDIKDEAFKEIKSELNPFFDEFKTLTTEMTEEELNGLKSRLSDISSDYSDETMIDPLLSKKQIGLVLKEILSIKDIIPNEGSLKYEYMPEAVKEKINQAALRIINTSAACRSNYIKYIDTSEEIRKIYSDNPDSLKEAKEYAETVVLKSVGNKILKAVKQLILLEQETEGKEWEKNRGNYETQAADELVMSIALMLSRGISSNNSKFGRLKSGELSKQAKIELAKKLESKALDWGQNEWN